MFATIREKVAFCCNNQPFAANKWYLVLCANAESGNKAVIYESNHPHIENTNHTQRKNTQKILRDLVQSPRPRNQRENSLLRLRSSCAYLQRTTSQSPRNTYTKTKLHLTYIWSLAKSNEPIWLNENTRQIANIQFHVQFPG